MRLFRYNDITPDGTILDLLFVAEKQEQMSAAYLAIVDRLCEAKLFDGLNDTYPDEDFAVLEIARQRQLLAVACDTNAPLLTRALAAEQLLHLRKALGYIMTDYQFVFAADATNPTDLELQKTYGKS